MTDDLDFAFVFPNFGEAYSHSGRAVAKTWSKARILARPGVYADKTKFSGIVDSAEKIRKLDSLRR